MKIFFDPLGMWEEKHGSEPGLPGHSFTSKQLFWIALAQVSLFILHCCLNKTFLCIKSRRKFAYIFHSFQHKFHFQGWCAVKTDEALKTQILTDNHSPQAFRTIGPLSNNDDFAKDFNCPKGSKMNPEKKCTVW